MCCWKWGGHSGIIRPFTSNIISTLNHSELETSASKWCQASVEWRKTRASTFETTRIHFNSDVFAAVAVVVAKALYFISLQVSSSGSVLASGSSDLTVGIWRPKSMRPVMSV